MKIALIVGIVTICLLGFLLFVWYISKSQSKKPIDNVKEQEKKEVDFIKQRQTLYQKNEYVEKVNLLSSENRGALFERAIERKRNHYRDDDDEYEKRLAEQKQNKQEEVLQEEPPKEEFIPVKHAISSFIKTEALKEEENQSDEVVKTSENENSETEQQAEIEKVEENTTTSESSQETEKEEKSFGRIFRNEFCQSDLEKQKIKIDKYQEEKRIAIQTFRDEILLEAENIKKRRKILMTEE